MNRFLEINGRKVEINHIVRDETRPTLIFLHEGLGCVQMWRDFPTDVADATGCNLLVYSRFGYGQSDPVMLPRPVRYMHDEALTVLPAIIEALQIEQHILIGHSDGGSIALINGGGVCSLGLPAPARGPLGIVTLAAHIFNEAICIESIQQAKAAYETTNLREKLAKHHADVDNAFWGWCNVWQHPDFWYWNLEEYLPLIDVPLLAIQGVDDEYGTLAQVDAIVAGAGGYVEKELLPDCRHSPHRDQPEATLGVICNFVERILSNQLVANQQVANQ